MKICLLCRNFFKDQGGIEVFIREYAKALGERGHQVHIIAQDCGKYNRETHWENVTVVCVPLKETPCWGYWRLDSIFPVDDLRFSRAAAKEVLRLCKDGQADIVETMDYYRQGIWLALKKRVPIFHRLHGWMFNRQEGRINPRGGLSLKEKVQWHFLQKCVREADGIATVSQDFGEFASEVWNMNDHNVRVIHNAVDAGLFSADRTQENREQRVFFAARLAKIKGVKVLADCAPEVLKSFPQVKFVLAGKDLFWPQEGMTAGEYLKNNMPAENLELLGEIPSDEVKDHYQSCQVCVLPSLYEPFGITALEAMASGCALVAAKAGGLKEIVSDGEDGLLAQPGNEASLAECIKRFLADDALRNACAESARKKAEERFSYERLVNESLDAYKEAIACFERNA